MWPRYDSVATIMGYIDSVDDVSSLDDGGADGGEEEEEGDEGSSGDAHYVAHVAPALCDVLTHVRAPAPAGAWLCTGRGCVQPGLAQ